MESIHCLVLIPKITLDAQEVECHPRTSERRSSNVSFFGGLTVYLGVWRQSDVVVVELDHRVAARLHLKRERVLLHRDESDSSGEQMSRLHDVDFI